MKPETEQGATHHNTCPRGERCACYLTGYTDAEYDHGHALNTLEPAADKAQTYRDALPLESKDGVVHLNNGRGSRNIVIVAADKTQGEWTVDGNKILDSLISLVGIAQTHYEAVNIKDKHNAALTAEREKHRKEMETVTMNTSDIETIQQLREQLDAERELPDRLMEENKRLLEQSEQLRSQLAERIFAKVKEGK